MAMKVTLFFLAVLTSTTAEFTDRDSEMYATIFSGHYSNVNYLTELHENGFDTAQNILEMYVYAINYPALHSDIVLFFNELMDGNVTRQMFLAINQSGPIIHMDHYNVPRPKIFNQGFVDVSELESFSVDDLKFSRICQSIIQRIGETIFTSEYPNCNIDGYNSVTYKVTHTCKTFTFYIDTYKVPESHSTFPYVMVKDESYPIPASIFPDYDKYEAMCNY